MTLLARAHLRQLWRERWQALLAVLGVAVGVAVVVAVDLVNASSREAMRIASAQVSGTATHVLFGPGEQLDETRYAEIRRRWRAREGAFEGVVALAPVVTGRAVLRDALGAPLPVQVLGIDPVSDAAVRDFVSAPGEDGGAFDGARLLTERGTVLLDARSAYRAGLAAEDLATIEIAGVIREIRVLAVLDAVDDALGDGLMLADIATAQELLGRQGWLDRVDLVRGTAGRDTAGRKIANRAWPSIAWLERAFPGLLVRRPEPVTERLPGGLRIEAIAERSEDTRALASSFQLNLAALGLLAIVVGLFLIHGTMRFSVLRRQRQFGALRALGVMPVELGRTVMLEAFVLALIGTAFGLLLGRVLAGGLLGLVSATLQGLYDPVAIGARASDPALAQGHARRRGRHARSCRTVGSAGGGCGAARSAAACADGCARARALACCSPVRRVRRACDRAGLWISRRAPRNCRGATRCRRAYAGVSAHADRPARARGQPRALALSAPSARVRAWTCALRCRFGRAPCRDRDLCGHGCDG